MASVLPRSGCDSVDSRITPQIPPPIQPLTVYPSAYLCSCVPPFRLRVHPLPEGMTGSRTSEPEEDVQISQIALLRLTT